MSPALLYNALVNRKSLPKLRERMGYISPKLCNDRRRTIWIHACSVGEVLSVQPLAQVLQQQFPDFRFVFSVITSTGRKIADQRFASYGEDAVFYCPIDMPSFVNRVLSAIRPEILIVIDTEIWPNLLHACRQRGIPAVMANGRISARSFRYYRWLQPLMGPVLSNYAKLMMKDQEDADRIKVMGAQASRVTVTGNLKYDRDIVEKDVSESVRQALDDALHLSSISSPIILAGSTHEGEEFALCEALIRLRCQPENGDVRLLLAPRHPDRFDSVASMVQKSGLTVARRSLGTGGSVAAVLILDSLGELAAAYSFCSIAFVGGTLVPVGGHSIMEPALYSKPIVVGPYTGNLAGIIDDFISSGAAVKIDAGEESREQQIDQLTSQFARLLMNEATRTEMGKQGQALFSLSKGATASTVKQIVEILERKK